MSIHLDKNTLNPADHSQSLRQELKDWEKAFAARNAGRKASREDIKKNPDIAQKYTLYNKLRARSSSTFSKSSPAANKLPRPPNSSTRTPQKQRKSIDHLHPSILDPYEPPLSSHKRTPTAHRISIGPTPQKDGQVLGIFDLLSPASGKTRTPSKQTRNSLNPIHGNSLRTPVKKRHLDATQDGSTPSSSKRLKPSPTSTPNKSSLLTPPAHRAATPASRKPSSDDTPAFLKRYTQPSRALQSTNGDSGLDCKSISWSPEINVRMRMKPAGKGLSALVRGLREMADDQLDEEMDLMREMDEGGGGGSSSSNFTTRIAAAASSMKTNGKDKDKIEVSVQNSQVRAEIEMPLGPDRGLGDESEEDKATLAKEGKGRDGKPLRIFKKRGQKRSTRMTIMRPTKAKWKPEPKWKEGEEGENNANASSESAIVQETQLLPPTTVTAPDDDDQLHTDNDDAAFKPNSEVEEEEEEADPAPHMKKKAAVKRPKKDQKQQQLPQEGDEKAEPKKEKKKKKKIAATAHANFRVLKIRGKGAGGKGGARFARRVRGR